MRTSGFWFESRTTAWIWRSLSLTNTLMPWLLLVIPVFAYGFAWFGHFFIEKNRPATFSYPLWSLFGDFKMYWYFLNGKMNAEVIRLYGHYAPDADAPLRVS